MTREEYIKLCKQRALAEYDFYKGREGIKNAIISIMSDLRKHEDTKNHVGIDLAGMMLFGGMIQTEQQLRDFINGFN